MKYITQNWEKKCDGILYFFQRLEEMLFHYSSDIVRMPVHNSRTLLREYLINESEHSRGRVKEYQLEQILAEVKYSLQTDDILRNNLGTSFIDEVTKDISLTKGDMIRYIFNKIPPKVYFNWSIEYIKKHTKESSHKEEIEKGLRTWIVEVVSKGYTPEYIYSYLHSTLASRQQNAEEVLDSFLGHFSLESNEYRVYFAFTHAMHECKDLISQRLKVSFEDDGNFSQIKIRKNDFIGYIDEKGLDRLSALHAAYSKISIFLKYYRVLSNRKKELIRKMGYIKEEGITNLFSAPVKSNGYRSIEVEPTINVTYTVDNIILACQSKSKETRIQLNKAMDLHNEALRQSDLNDGFLNLWSILEVICADSSGGSKIDKVLNGIIPILKKDYMSSVLLSIQQDLRDNMDASTYSTLFKTVEEKYPEKDPVGCLIFMPEFDSLLENCFEHELAYYPVIRDKIYRLYRIRNDKTAIKNLYDKYAQRISWHIYRLYRSRNAIVHSGETPKHIQQLGEHLHIYVDGILLEIMVKLADEPSLRTISDVLIDTKLLLNRVMMRLSEKTPISIEDISYISENYFHRTPK